jgi:hypothetical protein
MRKHQIHSEGNYETNVYVFVPDCGDDSFRLFQNVFFEFANMEFQSDPDVQIFRFRFFMARTRTHGGVFGPTITGGRCAAVGWHDLE